MAELELTYGAQSKTIVPFELRLSRRDTFRRYNYFNGGGSKKRLGAAYVIKMMWEVIDSDNYDNIVTVLDWIRMGYDVQVTDVDGLNYIDADDIVGVSVDIDDDDLPEQDFKLFEKMPFEVTFISSRVEPWRSAGKDSSWRWGSTDTTFDDVSDKTFEEYD